MVVDHHPDDGTVGFALNRPLDVDLNDIITDFPEIDAPVFLGGPVANQTLYYMHDKGNILDESLPVMSGLYWSGDFDKLKFLIRQELIRPKDIRFYVGYSGWSAGQLDDELSLGTWITTRGNKNHVFAKRPANMWRDVNRQIGGTYSVIAEMPMNNNIN